MGEYTTSKNWPGLDKFDDLYSNIPWRDGPTSYYMQQTCYISISSSEKLAKVEQRKRKQSDNAQCSSQTSVSDMLNASDEEKEQQLPAKRLRTSVCGPLYDKTKCVWCMQDEDTKHPKRTQGQLYRLNTRSAWRSFRCHTVLIEDEELRIRLPKLVESTTTLLDPFANDIMYRHHACLLYHHTKLQQDNAIHFQNVNLSEARQLFLRHVDLVIFTEREIRSLWSFFIKQQTNL